MGKKLKLDWHHQEQLDKLKGYLSQLQDGHLTMAIEEDLLSINYRNERIKIFKAEIERREKTEIACPGCMVIIDAKDLNERMWHELSCL